MLHQQTIRFVNNRILPLHSPHRPRVYRKLSPYCCHFCATYYKYFFHIHFLAQSMPYFVHFKHTRQINSVEIPLKTQFVAAKLNHACWSLSNGGQSRIQFHFRLHYFIWNALSSLISRSVALAVHEIYRDIFGPPMVKWMEINLKIIFLLLPFENMKFPQNFLAGAEVLTAGAGGEMTEFAQL